MMLMKKELEDISKNFDNREVKSVARQLLAVLEPKSQHNHFFYQCYEKVITSEEICELLNAYRDKDSVKMWRLVRASAKPNNDPDMRVSKRFDHRKKT